MNADWSSPMFRTEAPTERHPMPLPTVGETRQARIQSLTRADDILTAVMGSTGPISLATLSEKVNLNKTTVLNLAERLVVLGFLERPTNPKGYKLGLRCQIGKAPVRERVGQYL